MARRRLRRVAIAVGLVAVVVLAAWVLPMLSPGRHEVRLPGSDSFNDITVRLRDSTGLVASFAGSDPDREDWSSKVEVDNDGRTLLVTWLGGACDSDWEIQLASADGDLLLTLDNVSIVLGCTGLGVPRAVSIELSEPVGDRVVELEDRG